MTAIARPARRPGIFWGLSSFQILAMFRRGLFYAYLSVYLRYYLDLSVTATTLFATLPMLANIAAQNLIWGRLSDRYQRRRSFIIGGELLGAMGTVAVWYLHTLAAAPRVSAWIIIAGLTVVEFFWAMSNIGWSALITDLYPPDARGAIQGRLTSIGGIGRIAGVWIGGLLYDGCGHYFPGWGFAQGALFFVAAGVMLISTLPMIFMPEGGIASGNTHPESSIDGGTRASFRYFLLFLVAMALINFGRNSVVVIQSQYLFLDTGFAVSSRTLAHIFNTESVAMIVTGLLIGRMLTRSGNALGILTGAAISLVYLLIFATTDRLPLIYAASFLKGIAEAMIVAASYAAASIMIPPWQRARWFGFFNATYFLSWGLAGTLIAGPLADLMIRLGHAPANAYRFSYLAAFGLTLAGAILLGALFFGRHRPAAPREE
ncbi:MAG: MFS transporter [Desulfobacterales bacterium]|nr:MFS transporter [Desulfobacterales bacterium]